MNLRKRRQFPNWPLALQFLQRSPVNFLLTAEPPPEDVPDHIRRRIILWGLPTDGKYLSVPASLTENQVEAVASGLLQKLPEDHGAFDFTAVRSTNFMTFLNDYTQILNGKFKLREVAQAITDKTCTLFNAEGTSILRPTEQDTYRFAVITAETEEIAKRLDQIEVPNDKGITGWVTQNRRSLLVNDSNRELMLNTQVDERTQFTTREVMAAPIMVGERFIGIIQVVSRRQNAFNKHDLQILVLIAGIVASFIDKAQLYDEKLKLAKMQKELEIARRLQLEMMPGLPTEAGPFKLTGDSRQIRQVGGDFWDVVSVGDYGSLVILGDVSGHGLSAALVMSAVRTALRTLKPLVASAHDMIEPLNKLIHEEFGVKGHYATMLFMLLDHEERKVSYLRAGHEYPVTFTKGGRVTRLKQMGSWPFGLFGFRQDDKWYDIPLEPGDSIILYTDGVVDGLDLEDPRVDQLLETYPDLVETLDSGRFFDYYAEKLGWESVDDATMLKLTLTEN